MRLFSTVLVIVFIALSVSAFQEPQIVTDVKSGSKTLECEFHDGWRVVPQDKIVGLDDMSNRWIFTNGSVAGKNCDTY